MLKLTLTTKTTNSFIDVFLDYKRRRNKQKKGIYVIIKPFKLIKDKKCYDDYEPYEHLIEELPYFKLYKLKEELNLKEVLPYINHTLMINDLELQSTIVI
jgi:cell division protein FtsX